MARISAISRRKQEGGGDQTLTVLDLTLDLLARTATRQGSVIELHAK